MLITVMLMTISSSFFYSYESWESYKLVTKIAEDLNPEFTLNQIEKAVAQLSDSESEKIAKIHLNTASFELGNYHEALVGNASSAVDRYFYLMLITGVSFLISIGVWAYVVKLQRNSNQ